MAREGLGKKGRGKRVGRGREVEGEERWKGKRAERMSKKLGEKE